MTEPLTTLQCAPITDARCPTCQLGWWLNPPVTCDGSNHFRCVECKAVYSGEMLAAPDMLEALRKAEAAMSIIPPRTMKRHYLATIEATRAAIAKAEGRTLLPQQGEAK